MDAKKIREKIETERPLKGVVKFTDEGGFTTWVPVHDIARLYATREKSMEMGGDHDVFNESETRTTVIFRSGGKLIATINHLDAARAVSAAL